MQAKLGDTSHPSSGNNAWRPVLTLDRHRQPVAGNAADLAAAIGRAADLRIYTEFRHNEHIDTASANNELVKEVADFRVTYLLDQRWVAGIINLRQPISLPEGFGPRPSMSFFLYNQDGGQAIARPYLDGLAASDQFGASPLDDHSAMPKYTQFDAWDSGTNAPSSNFFYEMETFRYCVRDDWREVLSHTESGEVVSGSLGALEEEFAQGCEVKVGIRDFSAELAGAGAHVPHETFVHCGSCYYYTESRRFMAASQPVVRVQPAIPLRYASRNWDFGWLMPRSDGHVARWLVNPQTLKFERSDRRHALRWFVR